MKPLRYRAFGLTLESEIPLPELERTEDPHVDGEIIRGPVPKKLEMATGSGILFETNEEDFLIRFKDIAAFRVTNGKRIIVEECPDANDRDIRIFLLGSVMAALLHQRGMIPMHGSAIYTGKEALLITGPSASGKSSLAAGLATHGYPVLADDIAVLDQGNDKGVIMYKGLRRLKLWKDVMEELHPSHNLEAVRPGLQKYFIETGSEPDIRFAPVKKVLVLSISNQTESSIKELSGISKFDLLYRNIYRINFAVGMNKSEQVFQKLNHILLNTRVYSVIRPSKPMLVKDLSRFVIQNFIK